MDAERRMLRFFLCTLCLFSSVFSQQYHEICNNSGLIANLYEHRPNSHYCYRLFETTAVFSAANRSCARSNGLLARIDSEEEDSYILNKYFNGGGMQEFWIGLSDQNTEGVFRWVDGNEILNFNNSYTNWVGGNAAGSGNEQKWDCVKFTATGWRVNDQFCEVARLPYLCRQKTCNSTNGLTCLEIIKEVPVITPEIIAVIVIVAVAIIVLIVIIIFLLWLWKYQNDAFYRYILCCVYGGSKTQINNLKQENIRLRNELSQQKLNLNASGRFQGLSRQNSQNIAASPTSIRPPLGIDVSPSKMPMSRAISIGSTNRITPVPMLRSPQPSVSTLPIGRSSSIGSSFPIKTPMGMPVLPSIKEKTTPMSEIPGNRPSSSESSSSNSSNQSEKNENKQKVQEEKKEDVEEIKSNNETVKKQTDTGTEE